MVKAGQAEDDPVGVQRGGGEATGDGLVDAQRGLRRVAGAPDLERADRQGQGVVECVLDGIGLGQVARSQAVGQFGDRPTRDVHLGEEYTGVRGIGVRSRTAVVQPAHGGGPGTT